MLSNLNDLTSHNTFIGGWMPAAGLIEKRLGDRQTETEKDRRRETETGADRDRGRQRDRFKTQSTL